MNTPKRQFGRGGDRTRDRVRTDDEDRADQQAPRYHHAMRRATGKAYKVRRDQAHEKHHAAHRDRGPGGERATKSVTVLSRSTANAEIARLGFAERERVVGARLGDQHGRGKQYRRSDACQDRPGGTGDTAQPPERQIAQLFVAGDVT